MSMTLPHAALVLSFAALVVSAVLTAAVRRYSLSHSLLDIPNARSLHEVPIPRGGGLSFVVVFLAAMAGLCLAGIVPARLALSLGPGGFIVALAGWLDDRGHVPVRIRLAAQFVAAALAVAALNGFESLDLGWYKVPLGMVGSVLACVGIVWMLNLYNFMDGIDGIAGLEAVTTALFAAGLLAWMGASGLALLCVALASAVAGFLVWNWPPAKVFMGDVGSGFLGYVFAVLAIASEKAGAVPVLAWVLLLGVFVADTTVTLFLRMRRGETIWQAHRSHFYQRAVQSGLSHKFVTASTGLINVALGVLAAASAIREEFLLGFLVGGGLLIGAVGQRIIVREKRGHHETSAAE